MSKRAGGGAPNGSNPPGSNSRQQGADAAVFGSSKMQVDRSGSDHPFKSATSLLDRCKQEDKLDQEFGFNRVNGSPNDHTRLGWLFNTHPVRHITPYSRLFHLVSLFWTPLTQLFGFYSLFALNHNRPLWRTLKLI